MGFSFFTWILCYNKKRIPVYGGKIMKRVLCLVMMFVMLITFNLGSHADVVQEAQTLKDLNLLKGNGEGFNLGGQLKRSEAATFIVKVLGEEKEVTSNHVKYSNSPFEDVLADAWYAPYVGYCHENGIVSGFNDGTFRPDDFVSEKAFLTMLLQAMGYEADVDFDWNTVHSKAYDVGLSNDIQYAVKTDDNLEYIRGDVVRAIYNALDKKVKEKDSTVVERLVDQQVTSLYMAKKHDLVVVDEVEADIVQGSVVSENVIEVTFNEDLEPMSKDVIKIIIDGNRNGIQGFEQDGDKIKIRTEESLYSGRSYSILFEKLVDLHGNETGQKEFDLEGIEREVIKSDEFLISYIEPLTDNLIEVHFTQPIDESAEIQLMYKFGLRGNLLTEGSYKNIEVNQMSNSKTGVLIKFNEMVMNASSEYELFVRGDLESQYGQYLGNGEGDSYDFSGSDNSLGKFEVADSEIMDFNYIKVKFNRLIDDASGLDEKNYKLYEVDRGTSKIPTRVQYYQDDEGIHKDIVMLRYSSIKEDTEYRLEVKDVLDVYQETRVEQYENEMSEGNIDFDPAEVDDITVLDRSTIEIMFSEPLSEDSIKGFIDIDNGISVKALYWNEEEPAKLIIYLKKSKYLDEDDEYELKVKAGVDDYLGRGVEEDKTYDFFGEDYVRDSIEIVEARYFTDTMILVKLSDLSRETDLKQLNNYEFEYVNGIVKKKFYPYEVDVISNNEIVLKTESAYEDGEIRFYMHNVYDFSGQFKIEELSINVDRLDN